MASMGLVNNINNFLGGFDAYRSSPTPDQLTPGVPRSQGSIGNDEEPQNNYFLDATWSHGRDFDSSSGGYSGDSQFSNMPPTYAHSEGSQPTTDNSSVDTPPPDESPIDKSESPTLIDIDEVNNPLDIPYYDKDQALPRPLTLDISNRVTKKTRYVKDINKTNQVRGTGACIKCRLQKVPCSTAYPCETCKKACPQMPEVCCIRHELVVVARELAFRRFDCLNRREDIAVKDILRTAQPRFRNSLFVGRILFDRDPTKSGLEVLLRNYDCSADGRTITHSGCTFSRDHANPALTLHSLQRWAEQFTSSVEQNTFEGGVESFIKTCSASLLPTGIRPQIQALVQKAHVFKCMYKIYRCRTLYFLQANAKEPQQLPGSAQAEIRGVAKSAIESSERDILAELDKFFKAPKLNEAERAVVWAVLWQLMLIYRDLLRNMKPWCNSAEPLLNAVAVFYAALFRTSASLKLCLDSIKLQNPEVAGAFNFALSLRDTFYESIISGVATIDQRLKGLAVATEMKVLRRRPNKKAVAGKQNSAFCHDGDFVMGGC